MISGSHVILYSTDADADRAFFKDVLKLPNVDVGDGWLIFSLPPAELGVHPARESSAQEFYLMCDDINAFTDRMGELSVSCSSAESQDWGVLVYITLPGGAKLGVYQPHHARPAV